MLSKKQNGGKISPEVRQSLIAQIRREQERREELRRLREWNRQNYLQAVRQAARNDPTIVRSDDMYFEDEQKGGIIGSSNKRKRQDGCMRTSTGGAITAKQYYATMPVGKSEFLDKWGDELIMQSGKARIIPPLIPKHKRKRT
jgi:hypothetical protein